MEINRHPLSHAHNHADQAREWITTLVAAEHYLDAKENER